MRTPAAAGGSNNTVRSRFPFALCFIQGRTDPLRPSLFLFLT